MKPSLIAVTARMPEEAKWLINEGVLKITDKKTWFSSNEYLYNMLFGILKKNKCIWGYRVIALYCFITIIEKITLGNFFSKFCRKVG